MIGEECSNGSADGASSSSADIRAISVVGVGGPPELLLLLLDLLLLLLPPPIELLFLLDRSESDESVCE